MRKLISASVVILLLIMTNGCIPLPDLNPGQNNVVVIDIEQEPYEIQGWAIDLNNDNVNDLEFNYLSIFEFPSLATYRDHIVICPNGEMLRSTSGTSQTERLRLLNYSDILGSSIPDASWGPDGWYEKSVIFDILPGDSTPLCGETCTGFDNKYLAFRVDLGSSDMHYGWIKFSQELYDFFGATLVRTTIHQVAYNTEAGLRLRMGDM